MDYSSLSNPSSCDSTSVAGKLMAKKKHKGISGVKLSSDPQSVAARERRHRISERFKILQSMVPGGSKMDTVSMLEQAIQYVKFLKAQILLHQAIIGLVDHDHDHDNGIANTAAPPFQPNNTALPSFSRQELDCFTVDRVLAEYAELGLPESWFSGEENWGCDASMQS